MVLDGEQRAALAVVRSLGRMGHVVHVGSCARKSIAGGSRYAHDETLLPDPLTGPGAYSAAVAEMTARFRADILLPITEASTLAILENRHMFGDLPIPTSEAGHFQRATNKAGVIAVARRLGIDVPNQWTISSAEGAHPDISQITFPVAVKPSRSVIGSAGGRRQTGVAYADSPAELSAVIADFGIEARPLLIQSKVIGPGLGVFLLRWNGQVMASFAHRRLREKPPSGGVSVYCESVPAPAGLLAKSEALLAELDWSGVAMIEFKLDTRSGRFYLMEVNPRFWGSLQLAIDAGVDFPKYLVGLALGEPIRPVHQWRTGIRSRWCLGDIDHLLARLRRSRADLHLAPDVPNLLRVGLSVLTPWRPNERCDVFRMRDPVPSVRELVAWVRAL